MKDAKTILLTSIILLLIILYGIQSYEYISLINSYNKVLEELKSLKEENEILKTMVVRGPSRAIENGSLQVLKDYIEGYIVAVSIENENMEGILIKYRLSVKPGDGNIFISISPHVGVDLQTSLELAREAAGKYLDIDMNKYDIYLVIEAPREVGLVDGPSAGLLLTLSIIAYFEDYDLNKICVTGAIDDNGRVYPVGGILEKALVCAGNGMKIMLVPPGQSKTIIYEKVERTIIPGFTVVVIEPREIDIQEYLIENGYDMEVYEVSTVGEALKIILEN